MRYGTLLRSVCRRVSRRGRTPTRLLPRCLTQISPAIVGGIEPLEQRVLMSTYTVSTVGDGPGSVKPAGPGHFRATTLRAALNAANAHAGGDVVNFAPNVKGAIELETALPPVSDDLAIAGPGAARLTVQRSAAATTVFSIFFINAGEVASISDLTISGGTGTTMTGPGGFPDTEGGGVYNAGTLLVAGCTLTGNISGAGGGVYNAGSLALVGSTLSGNRGGQDGGGGLYNTSQAAIFGCTFSVNSGFSGGAIQNAAGAVATVAGSTFTTNFSTVYGGAIKNEGTLAVSRSTFTGNFFAVVGGALWNAGTATLDDCTITGGSADLGGGLYFFGGTATLNRCTISGNTAFGPGGGILLLDGNATLTDCAVTNNTAADGGGIFRFGGTLTLIRTTVSGNTPNDIAP